MSADQSFYVYILECADGTYYIGKTNDLAKRLRQHNGELAGGAKYTRGRRPLYMKFSEAFTTHAEAARREIYLKTLTRNQKKLLIQQETLQ